MPCEISDVLGYRTSAGALVGLASQQIFAVPGSPLWSVSYAGTWRPLNGLNPLVSGSPVLRYAELATSDGTGTWSLTLPYASETEPAAPEAQWSLLFPDGSILTGVVPAVAGPVSLRDLRTTYGWTWAAEVYVAPVTLGTFAKGTVIFGGGASTATVLFLGSFVTSAYQITLTPSTDTNDGSIPRTGWSDKTTTGFVINLDSSSFVGSVDWEAQL